MRGSMRVQPDASELTLRKLFHRIADAFAAEAARPDSAEGIGVEAEAARFVDPERADVEYLRQLERRVEAARETGALQPELGRIRQGEGRVDILDRLHHDDGAERLFQQQPGGGRRVGDNRRTQDAALTRRR